MPARDYVEVDPTKKIEFQLQTWSELNDDLHRLKESIRYTSEFIDRFSMHMHPNDRVQIVDIKNKSEKLYWKYFQRLIQKIQGI